MEQSASSSENSHPIIADIRTEAKALFVYVPRAHLRVLFLRYTNVLIIIFITYGSKQLRLQREDSITVLPTRRCDISLCEDVF